MHLMMNDADARDLIRRSLAELPGASGTNNHQGSLATEDQRLMGLVMEELRDRDQYFLDSRTSAKSIAESSARKAGLQAARRNVFLDNHQNEAAIRRQWDKAVARALKKGESIAIGHPYPETLAVLDRALPELKNKGIDLVRVSDLVK